VSENTKDGIIILGLYDSGTTYLAKLLHEKGIKMSGEHGLYEDEETGLHYEDKEIVIKNIIEAKTTTIENHQAVYKPNPKFCDYLRKYKLRRQADGVPWGFKEPRCAVLAKAYMSVFRNCKFIICHRSPQRVAMTRYNNYDNQTPLNVISTYEHTHAQVFDTWREMRGQAKMFPFWHDGSRDFHKGQNDALNKFLDLDLDYVDGWKFDI
jgi:hypothetical protein